MNPHQLKSNHELLEYMNSLAELLARREEQSLAEKVRMAARFYGGSPSEFFHEARIALRDVESEGVSHLTLDEHSELKAVLEQIEEALRRIGGG